MNPTSPVSSPVPVAPPTPSQQTNAGRTSEKPVNSGTWKDRSWNCVRGIPNPFHYLWKYGPLAIGTGLLLMARACSAQVDNQAPCLKPVRYNPQLAPSKLERAWQQVDQDPEENLRTLFLESNTVYEAALDGVIPARANTRTITPTFIMDIAMPGVVNLQDMTLVDGIFYNKTPYTVDGLYVESDFVTYLNFARPVQGYTAVHLGCEFRRHQIIDMTTLGNNPYDLAPDSFDDYPEARAVNAEERRWVERMQIYQRHWSNLPGTLCELDKRSIRSGEHPLHAQAPCGLNDHSIGDYPISGVTTKLLIDPTLASGRFSEHTILELSQNFRNYSFSLRVNPRLIAERASTEPGKVRWAAKQLVHSYSSQYLLSSSINLSPDICARPIDRFTPVFPDYPGNRYTPANLVVSTNRLGGVVYRFELHSADTVSDFRMRLVSCQELSARVLLTDRHLVYLAFDQVPRKDVHVSFYSKESDQMASTTLSEFTSVLEGEEAVTPLGNPNVLADKLTKDLEITVKTDNNAWLSEFQLPDPSPNRVVRFISRADRPSVIHHDNTLHDLHKNWSVVCSSNATMWTCSSTASSV